MDGPATPTKRYMVENDWKAAEASPTPRKPQQHDNTDKQDKQEKRFTPKKLFKSLIRVGTKSKKIQVHDVGDNEPRRVLGFQAMVEDGPSSSDMNQREETPVVSA